MTSATFASDTAYTFSQNTWAYSDVVAGADGKFYLTHMADNGGGVTVEQWNGSSWVEYASFTAAQSNDTAIQDDLDLAIDAFGHLHIVFKSYTGSGLTSDRGVKYGTFDGTNWTFTKIESASDPNGWKNYEDPSLAIDANGKAYVVYEFTDAGTRVHSVKYATNAGGSWTTQLVDTSNDPTGTYEIHDPWVGVSPDGSVTITYVKEDGQNDYWGNLYLASKAAGGSISAPTKLIDAVGQGLNYYGQSGIDAEGKVHNIYGEDQYDQDGNLVSSTLYDYNNVSGTWTKEIVATSSTSSLGGVSFQDTGSTEYLMVQEWDPVNFTVTGWKIYYRTEGGNWQPGNAVDVGPVTSEFAMAVNADGKVMIISEDTNLRNITYITGDAGAVIEPVALSISGTQNYSFHENALNAGPSIVGAGMTVTAPSDVVYSGGTVVVSYGSSGSPAETLSVVNQGTGAGQIGLSGSTVSYGGVAIGTVDPTSNGLLGHALTIHLNASATTAAVQALLRDIAYTNTSDTPAASQVITVSLTDGGGHSAQGAPSTVTIIADNDAPAIAGDLSTTVSEGGAVTITAADLHATDPDGPGGSLVYTVSAQSHGQVLVNGLASTSFTQAQLDGGQVSFKHDGGETTSGGFSVVVSDGQAGGTSGSANFNVNVTPVNDPPTVSVPASIQVTEDVASALAGISFADVDAGSSTVTVTLSAESGTLVASSGFGVSVAGANSGTLVLTGSVASINSFIASSQVDFVTDLNATGSVNLAVAINDGQASSSGNIVLHVTPVNDAPAIVGIGGAINASEGSTVHPFEDVVVADKDGIGETFTATVTLEGGNNGVLTALSGFHDNGDGSYTFAGTAAEVQAALRGLTYQVAENQAPPGTTLTASFTLSVSDGTLSAQGTTSVRTISLNDAPESSSDGPIDVDEGGAVFVTVQAGVLANDTDVDHDILSVGAVSHEGTSGTVGTALAGIYGSLILNADGSYSYEADQAQANALAQGQSGTDTFSYTVIDGNGGTSTAELSFTVHGVNDVAVIDGTDTGTVTDGGTLVASGALSVLDPDSGEEGFRAQSDSKGAYGTFSLNAAGAWSYTLDASSASVKELTKGDVRQDTFTVVAIDGTEHTVTITVNGADELIDGTVVDKTTVDNGDGTVTQVIVIPVVTGDRQDEVGQNSVADIPVVTDGSGQTLIKVEVPAGVGLQATGTTEPKPSGDSITDLIREITAHTEGGSTDQIQLTGAGAGFLNDLPSDTPLLVQTIVLSNTGTASGPLVISGTPAAAGNPHTALVIDARNMVAGSEIQLENVEFAVIVGNVTVTGGDGSQIVFGDGANQTLILGADDDTLHGGDGDDHVGSHEGNDWLYGDAGNDLVTGGVGDDHVFGGTDNDRLYGEDGNDFLDGNAGSDFMAGGKGNDTYFVDSATDAIAEAKKEGTDTVYTAANIRLSANVENAYLVGDGLYGYGNGSANMMRVSGHGGVIVSGAGNDSLHGSDIRDRLYGESGNDKLFGYGGNDYITGGSGNDSIRADIGNDLVKGGTGDDHLYGGAGQDTIIGGDGNDRLSGGEGADRLIGQSGRDAFLFDAKPGKGSVDIITDFTINEDTIVMDHKVFKGIGAKGVLSEGAFWAGAAAHDVDDRIIYNANSGSLYYDRDGSGAAAQVKFATVSKHLDLNHWAFLIV